jgi:hypothetical protein
VPQPGGVVIAWNHIVNADKNEAGVNHAIRGTLSLASRMATVETDVDHEVKSNEKRTVITDNFLVTVAH